MRYSHWCRSLRGGIHGRSSCRIIPSTRARRVLAFMRSMSLGTFLADIGKTTKTTSTINYNASPGQHATRDTNLLQGKQQRTTFLRLLFQEKQPSLLRLLADQVADIGKTTRTTSTTYNNSWTRDNLLKGKQQSTTKRTVRQSFFLLRLLGCKTTAWPCSGGHRRRRRSRP